MEFKIKGVLVADNFWIAHINHIFPLIRQTFTYREVSGLREQNLEVKTFSMKNINGLELSEEAKPFIDDTFYLPGVFNPKTIYLNFKQFLKTPVKMLKWKIMAAFSPYSTCKTWREFIQSYFQFMRAAVLADEIRKINKTTSSSVHIHAQFIDGAATTAMIAADYLGVSFSFYSHTSNNVQFLDDKLKRAKFIFSISEFDKAKLCEIDADACKKISVIHCGIPLSDWKYIEKNKIQNPSCLLGG